MKVVIVIMNYFLVFIFPFTRSLGLAKLRLQELTTEERIVGGNDANIKEFPWIVSIKYNGGPIKCGGTIIEKNKILTAGHCCEGCKPSDIYVTYGSSKLNSDGRRREVKKFSIHPKYVSPGIQGGDICVITLNSDIKLGPSASIIEMNVRSEKLTGEAIVVGWGSLGLNKPAYSDILQKLTQPIISNKRCQSAHENYNGRGYLVTRKIICAGIKRGEGGCYADSGGPLTLVINGKTKLIGVASWAVPCAKGIPDAYSRVSYYAKWIQKQ